MHELAVLPCCDLTAGQKAGSGLTWGRVHPLLQAPPVQGPVTAFPTLNPRASLYPWHNSGHRWGGAEEHQKSTGNTAQPAPGSVPAGCISPALGADAARPALDLAVHVREACVVGFGLVGADLREGKGAAVGGLLRAHYSPTPCFRLSTSHRGCVGVDGGHLTKGSYRPPGDVIWPHMGGI